jgi:phosphohistidine phosphatase
VAIVSLHYSVEADVALGSRAMRHLMILRHAKTERDSPSGNDRDRRLTERGREDAPTLGRYIAANRIVPQCVLVSPATRARETWDLLKDELPKQPRHEMIEQLYGADTAELLHIVRAGQQLAGGAADRLMIVGHNPGLHEFALALTWSGDSKSTKDSLTKDSASHRALADNLPTSGLAIISFAIDDWADVSFGRGRLERLVSPALLREES